MSKTDLFDLFAHTRRSPVYYIENVDACADAFAVFIHNSIFDRVEQILMSRDIIDYYKDTNICIGGFHSINKGHCEDIAAYTYEEIKRSTFDVSCVRVLCLFYDDSPDTNNTQHTWIEYRSPEGDIYHFDSLVPWGVEDMMHIPIMYSFPWATNVTSSIKEIDPYNDIPEQIAGVYGFEHDIKQRNPAFVFDVDTDAEH